MPQVTDRQVAISTIDRILLCLAVRELFAHHKGLSLGSQHRRDVIFWTSARATVEDARYVVPRLYIERPIEALRVEIEGMRDADFKAEYRLSKPFFWRLYDLIKSHCVFSDRQRPAEYQLLVFLQFVGFSGNGSSYRRNSRLGRCSVGSVREYTDRCIAAIRALPPRIIKWPRKRERREISQAFEELHGIPGCVGVIDGTLMPLAEEPTKHGEDYFTRKSNYAINAIVVSDHRRRIRYVYAGWPGSSDDQRVFQNSTLYRRIGSRVDGSDFLVGDSAFTPNNHLISPYKKPPNRQMQPQHESFNEEIARLRICVEHCIGMLKGRFQCLKELRIRVTSRKETVKRIVDLIEACMIVHNLCITDEIPDSWIDHESDNGDGDALEEEGESPGAGDTRGDGARREQLLHYLISQGKISLL